MAKSGGMKRILSDVDMKNKILEVSLQLIKENKVIGLKILRQFIKGSEQRVTKFLDELIVEGQLPARRHIYKKSINKVTISQTVTKINRTFTENCIQLYGGKKRLLKEYKK